MDNEVDPMVIVKIGDIPRIVSDRIISAITVNFDVSPGHPLDIQKVFLSTKSTYDQIKKCCNALLTCGLIKASYFPVHTDCGIRIGGTEESSFNVESRIKRGRYDGICHKCGKRIKPNCISVGMSFWKIGAVVK